MENKTLPIYNTEGKETGTLKLDPLVFDGTVNSRAVYQAINAYRAKQRKGFAQTKTMGEVSGGGKKPWRQKGTGRARVGSIRSPLWRHGGVIFGPHPRSFAYELPKKIKTLALKSSLNAKVNSGDMLILEEFTLTNPKTKEAAAILSKLKLTPKNNKKSFNVLLLLDKLDQNLKKALSNISFLKLNAASDTHVYQVLTSHKLVITKEGLEALVVRIKR